MIRVVIYAADGRPLRNMVLRDAAEADMNTRAGEAWIYGSADLASDWIDAGLIAPRPRVAPIPTGGAAPFVIPLDVWPEGSRIRARNEEGDDLVITDLSEPLTLEDPGVYELVVEPPWPHMPEAGTVEVT